jgi:hypothetical protein
VTFATETVNPPTAQQATACNQAAIDALTEACALDPGGKESTACSTARALEANKTCAECLFGEIADAKWKAIVNDPATVPHYNQSGCIELLTGVSGCGQAYTNIDGCIGVYCEDTCTTRTAFVDCNDAVLSGECSQYALDGDCGNSFTAKRSTIEQTCFPETEANGSITDPHLKSFFGALAKVFCMSGPTTTGDADAN